MSLQRAVITLGPMGPKLTQGAPLRIEALLLGRPVREAAEMLPRLFNLCRAAQSRAANMCLGMHEGPFAGDAMRSEIIRDHVLKLCILLPRAFGLAPIAIPTDPAVILGPNGLPASGDLLGWASPAAALLQRIAALFGPHIAACPNLPAPPHPLAIGGFENSSAGRQAAHPWLRAIEASHGRGPLWRAAGMLVDLKAALDGRLGAGQLDAQGVAVVPAARGAYAVHIAQAGGLVTAITRRTPTDHVLAKDGPLLQSLATLPAALSSLAPTVVALHDPCIPVTVQEAVHA